MPLAGRAADRFGLPPLLLGALGIFALGLAVGWRRGVAAPAHRGAGHPGLRRRRDPAARDGRRQPPVLGGRPGHAPWVPSAQPTSWAWPSVPFLGATVLERFDLGPALIDLGMGRLHPVRPDGAIVAVGLLPGRADGHHRARLVLGRARRLGIAIPRLAGWTSWERRWSPTALASGLVCLTTLGETEVGVVACPSRRSRAWPASSASSPRWCMRAARTIPSWTRGCSGTAYSGRRRSSACSQGMRSRQPSWVPQSGWTGSVTPGAPEQRLVLGSLALAMSVGRHRIGVPAARASASCRWASSASHWRSRAWSSWATRTRRRR